MIKAEQKKGILSNFEKQKFRGLRSRVRLMYSGQTQNFLRIKCTQ